LTVSHLALGRTLWCQGRLAAARDYLEQVRALAKGFIAAGIEPGEKIGLMAKTRYEWTLIDFAAWFAGAILVPIYETSAPSQVHWNLSDAEAIAVIVEGPDQFSRFDEVHADLPEVRKVWQIDRGDLGKLVTDVFAELLQLRPPRWVAELHLAGQPARADRQGHGELGRDVLPVRDLHGPAADVEQQQRPAAPAHPPPSGQEGQSPLLDTGEQPQPYPGPLLHRGEHLVAVRGVPHHRRGVPEQLAHLPLAGGGDGLVHHLGQPMDRADVKTSRGVDPIGQSQPCLDRVHRQRQADTGVRDQQMRGVRPHIQHTHPHDR